MTLPPIAHVQCDGFDYAVFATGDYISQAIARDGKWEPRVLAAAQLLLAGFDSPTVLDVGANIGLFTLPIASRIAPAGGRLYAFEAQRIVFQQLCANVFANRIDNVWAYNQAVGDEPGDIDMPAVDYARAANIGAFSLDEQLQKLRGMDEDLDRSRTERIHLVTLDDSPVEGHVRLVKIDVEGMELNVVRGAHRFLEQHRFPPILFETWEDEGFAAGRKVLFDEIDSLGYAITKLGRDSFIAQHPDYGARLEVRLDGSRAELSRAI